MTETVEAPSKLDQLVDRYFAIRQRLKDDPKSEQADKYRAAVGQIEDHVLTHGTPDHIVRVYIAKRDDKEEVLRLAKLQNESTDAWLCAAEATLKRFLNEQKLTSSATEFGRFYKKSRNSVTVGDKESFLGWIKQDEARWVFLDVKANKTAAVEYKDANGGALPDGLNYREEEVVEVRR